MAKDISELKGLDPAQSQQRLLELEHQPSVRNKVLFGTSSEQRPRDTEPPQKSPRKPQEGHGPRPQPNLPLIPVVHDLPPDERACPACGCEMERMGNQSEDSEEIDVLARQFAVLLHKRLKYRCDCNGAVVTAPGPVKLQEGGRYSVAVIPRESQGRALSLLDQPHHPVDEQPHGARAQELGHRSKGPLRLPVTARDRGGRDPLHLARIRQALRGGPQGLLAHAGVPEP